MPTHIVHHLYYDPADYNGNAGYTLPFDVSGQQGTSGYLLDRAPAHSLFIADLKRRLTAGLLDPNPAIAGRADLQAWIYALPTWLSTYNQRTGTSLTESSVLSDAGGQRGLIQHFYGGLLDDELCALADVSGNAPAFAQLNSAPAATSSAPLTDVVNGNGFGRNLYGLRSVNIAGSAEQSHTERRSDLYPYRPSVSGTGPLQSDRAAKDGGVHPGVGARRKPGCRRLPRLPRHRRFRPRGPALVRPRSRSPRRSGDPGAAAAYARRMAALVVDCGRPATRD